MERDQRKDQAAEAFKSGLRTEAGQKKLTKEQRKEAQKQRRVQAAQKSQEDRMKPQSSATKTPVEKQSLDPGARARSVAADLQERLEFFGDPQGAYKPAWQQRWDEDSALGGHMEAVAKYLHRIQETVTAVLLVKDVVPADLIEQLATASQMMNDDVVPLISKVDEALRNAEKESATPPGPDAMRVLDGLDSLCDAKIWPDAVKFAKSLKGKIAGSKAVIDTLTGLVKQYYLLWNSLNSDGLKGVPYSKMQQLAEARMKIVTVVAESGDPFLMACCRKDTDFYNYVYRLAAQSCSSRDVQNFTGWWAANSRYS